VTANTPIGSMMAAGQPAAIMLYGSTPAVGRLRTRLLRDSTALRYVSAMGKVNDKSFQLRMAFADDDLRRPSHDIIMHWLVEWVRNPANVRALLGLRDGFHAWYDTTAPELDVASLEAWPQGAERDRVAREFASTYPSFQVSGRAVRRKEAWPEVPAPEWSHKSTTWEPILPLHLSLATNGHRQLVGFCDLMAQYGFDHSMERVIVRTYRAVRDAAADRAVWRTQFEYTGAETVRWSPSRTWLCVCFEVKTEIRSIGELMRQLQLYRSALPPRGDHEVPDGIGETWLCVVAPPHPEAAAVCRDQGFPFLEYRP
jgi:hypothetical protein